MLADEFMAPPDVGGAERSPITHEVKSWPHFFEATLLGHKSHEIRKSDDRDYRVGDLLNLNEYDPATERYSGRTLLLEITYITSALTPCALSGDGLQQGYSILSVQPAVPSSDPSDPGVAG